MMMGKARMKAHRAILAVPVYRQGLYNQYESLCTRIGKVALAIGMEIGFDTEMDEYESEYYESNV